MRARDLAQDLPVVGPDDSALTAARLIAEGRLPGIAVVDARGHPVAVLPASQVLRFAVPDCVQEDSGERVKDLLPPGRHQVEPAVVDGDATVLGCAAVMARLRSPVLAVTEGGEFRGLETAAHLLEVLLPPDDAAPGDHVATK